MDRKLSFHIENRLYEDCFGLYLRAGNPDGKQAYANNIEFNEIEEGEYVGGPLLKLQREQVQGLMDSLWTAGLRPTQGRQSEGVTAAQGNHLQDMRALAFAKLNVTPPEQAR